MKRRKGGVLHQANYVQNGFAVIQTFLMTTISGEHRIEQSLTSSTNGSERFCCTTPQAIRRL
jgi:hypothetical protein